MKRSDTTVGIALPRKLDAGGPSVVLMVHGIGSYPGVMDFVARRIFENGISASIPRLPGHGTNAADYISVKRGAWYRCIVDEYQNLKSRYERVYLAGLSLGGILVSLLASEFTPDGLILLAPAIRNTNRLLLLAPYFKPFIKRIPGKVSPEGQDMNNPEIKYIANEYWQWRWAAPFAEVRRLQRKAAGSLAGISCPTYIIVSKNDHTVPLSVADHIRKRITSSNIDVLVLDRSKHTLVTDCEKETVADALVERIALWENTYSSSASPSED